MKLVLILAFDLKEEVTQTKRERERQIAFIVIISKREFLNGVAKPWAVFVESVVGREHMPSWDCLWDDFI